MAEGGDDDDDDGGACCCWRSATAAGRVFWGACVGEERGWEMPGVEEDVAGVGEDWLVGGGGWCEGAALGVEGTVATERRVVRGRKAEVVVKGRRVRSVRRQDAQRVMLVMKVV